MTRSRQLTLWRLAPLAIAMAVGATACATVDTSEADERELAAMLDGRVPGKPVDCIDQSRVNGPLPVGNRTIVYRQSGKRIWVNRLRDVCPGLGINRTLVVHAFGNQLCRLNRFEVVSRDAPIPGATCFFGTFTPYDKVDPAAK